MPATDLDDHPVATRTGSPARTVAVVAAASGAAVAWAAQVSGASGSAVGRALGRLDLAVGVGLVVLAASVTATALGRIDEGESGGAAVAHGRRILRVVLIPWWVISTVALFGYPTAPGQITPSDAAAPTWVDVVREWLLFAPLSRPAGGPLPPMAGSGRLGLGWVVATVVLAWALAPLAARAIAAVAGARSRPAAEVALVVGAGAAVVGLALRLVAASTDPGGWGTVARTFPPAQLDLLGAGIMTGAWWHSSQSRPVSPALDRHRRGALLRLGGVVALALVVGAADPAVGSVLSPGSAPGEVVARAGMSLVGATLALWAMAADRSEDRAASVDRWAARLGGTAPAVVMSAPLAAQLWATRAGGAPGTQRLGPLVAVTLAGALAAGWAVAAGSRRAFGPDLERRWTPFSARLAWITAGAFAWRLLTLVSINRRNPDGGDPFYYHHQANMLADRVGYSEPFRWVEQGVAVPSAIHPPLLSTWLATGSTLGARTFLAHKLLTAVLGVGVVVVGALIARRLAGDRAALVTAALIAVYPNLWVIDGALWPEGVYATTVGLAVLAAYRWWERPDIGPAALLGVAIAVAAMARGEALFLFPLLVAPLFLRRRGISLARQIGLGVVAGLCGLMVLAPWTIRNLRAFDQVVLHSTNSDEVLYYANCEDSYRGEVVGYWSFNCQVRERERAGQQPASEAERALYARCLPERFRAEWDGLVPGEPPGNEADKAKYWRCLATDYISRNRDRIPAVVVARIGRELDIYRPDQALKFLQIEGRPRAVAQAGQLAWWAVAPVGAAGLWVLRRRRVLIWPLVSLGLMVLATTVYAYGAVRFRTPLELALLIGAGVAVDHLLRRRSAPAEDPARDRHDAPPDLAAGSPALRESGGSR